MGEIDRGRLLHVVGGLFGIAAFFLPWITLSSGAARISLTSVDMVAIAIQSFLGDEPLAGVTQGVLPLGLGIVAVGLLFLLAASAVTLVSPYGGPLMFVAAAISSAGLTLMTFGSALSPFGLQIVFSVDYGALLAFLAAILAIVGLLFHRASMEDQRNEIPPTEG